VRNEGLTTGRHIRFIRPAFALLWPMIVAVCRAGHREKADHGDILPTSCYSGIGGLGQFQQNQQ
jgi:hypothetical protein